MSNVQVEQPGARMNSLERISNIQHGISNVQVKNTVAGIFIHEFLFHNSGMLRRLNMI